ncbi:amidase [Roseiarcus fermentans]|uniref:Amidase n=1 Tax=Roseiarcus fermentans TaxID=1473586 RepID=A0A366F6A6_9HYPH|nr:amidase [Roseiarcus fermentans]RBP09245.1 amidase [Roseiarcus fermentans]
MHRSPWTYASAADLAAALGARRVSAVELARDAIARIEAADSALNAMCVRSFDAALAAAAEADQRLAQGERGPLLGVPMTIKESYNLAGTPTTWGFPQAREYRPSEDALIVARVKAAGAVVLGKTNVPVALGDWQSYNDLYGVTNNPYDPARTPGGSSGGSAAALAAGFGPLSLGSDIGGSLRAPAHFCGVFAHKPTHGLVPSRGHAPPFVPDLPGSVDLAVVGPMARTADDLATLFDAIAGPDELEDGVGYRLALPPPRVTSLAGARVLALTQHPLGPTDAPIAAAIEDLAAGLEKAGARVSRDSARVPDLEAAARLYMRALLATLAARMPDEPFAQAAAAAQSLDPADASLAAERLRGVNQTFRAWTADGDRRAGLRAAWRAFFRDFDALICPVMPTAAFPHDHGPDQERRRLIVNGEPSPYVDQLLWPGVATLPGLPATAIPVGRTPDGLPIGVQIVGPRLEDRTTLELARLIERAFGGFVPPPAFA